ncbi:MAG TPA: DNA endonuclease SmrA [Marinagarivorans sp.]
MSDHSFMDLLGGDVTPIASEPRVDLHKKTVDDNTLKERRLAAQQEVEKPDDPLSGDPVEMVEPLSLISYMRPGVQHGVYRNVRMGKYKIDARLDLHKLNVERARQLVYQFIKDCVANDVRMALITHGKGEGRGQPALLKSCVAHWLPQMDEVLAFHSAQKQHGSYGATYVLLRKSDAKKLSNRERHQKR